MDRDAGSDLVLVGGGHAHVQVLRRFVMRPLEGVRLTVVLDRAEAVYSGMVPGFVAGDYEASELEIDGVPLARRARARVILAAASRIDPAARRVELEGRPPLAYDVASLDVGSSVRGLELPGVREHALTTRPIRAFVHGLEQRLRPRAPEEAFRLIVVGGGAAGIELAFTLDARLRAGGQRPAISVLTDSPELLPGASRRLAERVRREAAARGIALRAGARVVRVEKDSVVLEGEAERLPCELAVWATGAAPPPLILASPLPKDAAGFVRIAPTLQVLGIDDLFASGDCASFDAHPWVPKAGVYAVREGPYLDANLRARLRGRPLQRFRPQSDFLSLLNLGGRQALGCKWGIVWGGNAVWRLKDAIDRRFVRRFQVIGGDGAPAPHFPKPQAMGGEPMACGGCAAKVDASSLGRALARLSSLPGGPGAAAAGLESSVLLGLDLPDDVAAVRLPRGDVLLTTVDGFRAFVEDPWLVGRVAAVNALSDVYAKGGTPRHALALVTVPEASPDRAEETLVQVLAGVRAALDPLGVALVGGHTTHGEELFVALSVTGTLDEGTSLLPLGGAGAGECLVLTKPLGTGVVLAADMQGQATGAWLEACVASMLRPNAAAARWARSCGATACTDVSGFGLAGHLAELVRASGLQAVLDATSLPSLPGALALLGRGLRSTYHAQNVSAVAAELDNGRSDPFRELLFDPQTSGGLLFTVPASRCAEVRVALREAGDSSAACIGRLVAPSPGRTSIRLGTRP